MTSNPKLTSRYIPAKNLPNLKLYKYSGADHSLISRYVLTPFWNRFVLIFPMWFAPNLITLTGLSFVLINFASLIYYNPSLNCVPKPLHVSKGGPWDPLFPPAEALVTVQTTPSWIPGWLSSFYDSKPDPIPYQSIGGEGCLTTSGWLYASWALGLFLYQTFDAVDGKQARRTGASGPLGEMFDHGCDALNTTLEVLLTASALNLGMGWWTIVSQAATLANFYLTTWEEYHTGTLYLSAFSGPVEGILIIIGIYIVTAFKGPGFWDTGVLSATGLSKLSILQSGGLLYPYSKDLPLNECFLLFGAAGLCFNIMTSAGNVLKAIKKQFNSQPSENGRPKFLSLAKSLQPLLGLVPFAAQAGIVYLYLDAQHVILRNNLIPFLLFWGLAFAYQVGLMITAYTTKSGFFPWYNILTIWLSVMCLDANISKIGAFFNLHIHGLFHDGGERSVYAVYGNLGLAVVVYGFFVYDVVGVICAYLDINCLTIKHPKAATVASATATSTAVKTIPDAPAVPSKPQKSTLEESYVANVPTTTVDDDDDSTNTRRRRWGTRRR